MCDGVTVIDGPNDELLDQQRLGEARDKAIAISGLSPRQVDYWARTGLVEPAVDTRVSPGRRIRLYGFLDLLALMVAAQLRTEYRISLQHIRRIVEHLKSHGYHQPLTQLRFSVYRGQVYFQHPDGQWEGDLRPDQLVLQQVLDLQPLRQRIAEGTRRDDNLAGKVEKRRGTLGGKPVFAGTRIPVDTVRRYLDAGRSTNQVLEAFPDLTPEDVEAVRRGGARGTPATLGRC